MVGKWYLEGRQTPQNPEEIDFAELREINPKLFGLGAIRYQAEEVTTTDAISEHADDELCVTREEIEPLEAQDECL